MARLRVLSWNIRTFGTHEPSHTDMSRIAEIIINSQADIVCIQELMIGNGVIGQVGAEISQQSIDIVSDLMMLINDLDPAGDWWLGISGANSGIADHMRDAYAFLFKQKPARSKFAHAEAPSEIVDLAEPVILRQAGKDNFKGRRPALFMVNVKSGDSVVPVNVISYHAPTPCDTFTGDLCSGRGINQLATLQEIGGGMQVGVPGGGKWNYQPSRLPLPQIDTIVLGDFNYSMGSAGAHEPYNNLLTNYQACVSDLANVRYTTYSPNSTQGLRLVSAYDNIFVLRKHANFQPSLGFSTGGVINFIEDAAKQLGDAIGTLPPDLGTVTAWYVIHLELYKRQHALSGLSDHLPVWAEFTLGGTDSTAARILPTSGADNNCLLHAIFGVLTDGAYVAADAAARRTAYVNALRQCLANRAIPNGGALAPLRNALLSSMINDFSNDPVPSNGLMALLGNGANPFAIAGFDELFARYIDNVASGRMLYVHEAEAIACIASKTVVLHYVDRGSYFEMTFNAAQPNPVHIYHQALHFSRWAP